MYRQIFLSNALKWVQNLKKINYVNRKFDLNFPNKIFIRNSRLYMTKRNNHRIHDNSNKGRIIIYSGILGSILRLIDPDYIDEDEIPKLILTLKRAIYMIQKEEYEKAEQMLHLALRLAQQTEDEEGITYTYDLMANLAFDTEDFPKAEKLFLTVMERLLNNGIPQDSPEIIHISLKLAKAYERMKDFLKAEIGYKYCKQQLKPHLDNNTEDEDILSLWGMTLDYYSEMLSKQARYSEAFEQLSQAYEICAKVNGEKHEKTVTILNDLGILCSMKGDYEKALQYLNTALEIGKELPETTDLGAIYVNLGHIYIQKGLHDDAKAWCEKGKTIAITRQSKESIVEANKCLNDIKMLMR